MTKTGCIRHLWKQLKHAGKDEYYRLEKELVTVAFDGSNARTKDGIAAVHPRSYENAEDAYPSRIKPVAEFISRKDPVVYSEWTQESPIAREQSDFYEKNGYLFLEDFFTDEEVDVWRKELKRLQEAGRHSDKDEVIREPESREVRSVFAVHRDNPVFRKLSEHSKLLGIVRYLLGSDVYVHQSRINFKPGFNGKEFYWHSDFETWHVEDGMPRMRALSCSIALEDNSYFNGPLMVVPGSHRTFVTCVGETPEDHYRSSLRRQEYGVPDQTSLTELVRQGGIEAPVGKAGSILLFDCNLMHGSSSNISPMPRSNVFLVYNSTENRIVDPFSGQKPRPDYIAAR
ncbi:ectoine hydroxylase [Paenibacillus naphthalenovorans]|uniref:ectoine hydroxylase n=1 Tax=Paenibacillus naphthalenovorans TaxID=162209 RepID=UPI00088E2730|nr:ectoine hydroxylase [Paenibacillus naphthalenovorans]SDI99980.1 ectoine hydroxylase [Paenibacillus naphthalenovorans]